MKKALATYTRFFGLTTLTGFAGLIGILALLVLSLVNEYREAEKHAQAETETLSRVLEEHALAIVQKVDLLLRDVQGQVRPGDMRLARGDESQRAGVLHALLKSREGSVKEVSVLHLTNANGEQIHSSLAPLPFIDNADRYSFMRQRDDPAAGLVISPPVISRTIGKWAIELTRRIDFEDGSFAGNVLAVLDLDYFQQFYRSLDLGPHGLVALYDKELHLAARYPPREKDTGKKISSLHVRNYIEKGIKHAVYRTKSPVDGIERLYSFRQVGETPLIVFAAIAEDDYLAQWRRHVWQYSAGAIFFGLAVLGFGRRQRRTEGSLREQSAFQEALLESIPIPVFYKDDKGLYLGCNRAFEEMLGRKRAEIVGKSVFDISPPEIAEKYHAMDVEIFERPCAQEYECEVRHSSGEIRNVIFHKAVFRRGNGSIGGLIGAVLDITEYRHLETELQQLNASLEQRIVDETDKNREKDLLMIQQSRLAAMGEMIGNIAHQWRQPLNALGLLIGNIKDAYEYNELDKATLDKSVEDGKRMIQKMSTTIDDFRNFFMPSTEKKCFRMCEGAEEAISLLAGSFKNQSIEIVNQGCMRPMLCLWLSQRVFPSRVECLDECQGRHCRKRGSREDTHQDRNEERACGSLDTRQRRGHPGRNPGQGFRSVLHHQGKRHRHRTVYVQDDHGKNGRRNHAPQHRRRRRNADQPAAGG